NAVAVSAAGFPEIAAALKKLAGEAEQHLADLEQLEQRLTALEEKLIATLKSAQSEEQLFTARRELDAQLRPYRGKMSAVLLAMLLGKLGAFWTVFERDYSPLLTCSAMAWASSQLPLALAGRVIPLQAIPVVAALSYLYFAVLMFFAVRTVFGVENGIAAGVVFLSWIPLAGAIFFWAPIGSVAGYLASPFFLFYGWRYLG